MITSWQCIMLVVILVAGLSVVYSIRYWRKTGQILGLFRFLLIICMVFSMSLAEDEPIFDAIDDGQPILFSPEPFVKAENVVGQAWQDIFGQQQIVDANHFLFLYGDYENGTWFLPGNNSTIKA